ncbi:hypothetical protein AAMO2058_001727400 [Amorphochlora amoebiformis]
MAKKRGKKKEKKEQKSDSSSRKGSKNGKSQGEVSLVIVLPFASMKDMAAGLARVSAYIEDPTHHGKPASEDKVSSLVASRYAGHNFSITDFKRAINALGKLTPSEERVQKTILSALRKNGQRHCYVIAHVSSDEKTLQHEKWHATYHFDADYRARVSGIWGMVKKSSPAWANQFMKHLGDKYAQHVWVDEFQAIVLNREYECATKVTRLAPIHFLSLIPMFLTQ